LNSLRVLCHNGGMTHTPSNGSPYAVQLREERKRRRKANFRTLIEEEGGLGLPSFHFTVSKTHKTPWIQHRVKSDLPIPYPTVQSFLQQGWLRSARRWVSERDVLMETFEVTDKGWAVIEEVES